MPDQRGLQAPHLKTMDQDYIYELLKEQDYVEQMAREQDIRDAYQILAEDALIHFDLIDKTNGK